MFHPEFKQFVYDYRPLDLLRSVANSSNDAGQAQRQRAGAGGVQP
jgi:hypothetical protein